MWTNISISFVPVFVLKEDYAVENFQIPFENVAEVVIFGGRLGNQIPHFPNWFPNLRNLIISNAKIDTTNTEVNFPKLENLTVLNDFHGICPNRIRIESASLLLLANPQLKGLDIKLPIETFDTLLNMISGNLAISKLTIERAEAMHVVHRVTKNEIIRFIREHPLTMPHCYFSPDDVAFLIRQSNTLDLWRNTFSILY